MELKLSSALVQGEIEVDEREQVKRPKQLLNNQVQPKIMKGTFIDCS